MNRFKSLVAVLATVILAAAFVACDFGTAEERNLRNAERSQNNVEERAVAAVPPYIPNAFPARETINRYLQETETGTEWYTYALNMLGEPIFYVLSDSKPQNICVSITPPDRRVQGPVVLSAPALDGVYYGGAGCNAYYTFDATTGGMIELAGSTFTLVSSKFPLYLDTDIRRLQPQVEEPAEE